MSVSSVIPVVSEEKLFEIVEIEVTLDKGHVVVALRPR